MDIKDDTLGNEENVILNFDIACQKYKTKIKFNKKIWDDWKVYIVDKIGKKIAKLREEKENEYEDDEDLK